MNNEKKALVKSNLKTSLKAVLLDTVKMIGEDDILYTNHQFNTGISINDICNINKGNLSIEEIKEVIDEINTTLPIKFKIMDFRYEYPQAPNLLVSILEEE